MQGFRVVLLLMILPAVMSFIRLQMPSSIIRTTHTGGAIMQRAYSSTKLQSGYKTFDEFIEAIELPVLVDFYAQWCGPCRMMNPVLEEIANKFEGSAKIAKVDTDKSPNIASKYDVTALPTLILFHKGKVIERIEGFRSTDALEKIMTNALERIKYSVNK
jgi:thioredoxin